jgi:hypothetical protein
MKPFEYEKDIQIRILEVFAVLGDSISFSAYLLVISFCFSGFAVVHFIHTFF